jgi:alpha-ketoglutarate-dependent 2,4-dichlorophenoxyacetate dioxygenase
LERVAGDAGVAQIVGRDRVAIHDFVRSRARFDPDLATHAERTGHLPVRHDVVTAETPNSPTLYLGQHATSVEGLNQTEDRNVIDNLMRFARASDFVYSQRWQQDDVLVRDNRAVMYRAAPVPVHPSRRHMVCTMTSCLLSIA